MKTVGIITCHYFDNYGSVLQAYALREYMNRLPGYQAEIINYIPEGAVYRPYMLGPVGKDSFEGKRRLFEHFLKERCGVTGKSIYQVTGNQYDYHCVGSDQLWNFGICDRSQEYFFSHLDPGAAKISYATSLGQSVSRLMEDRSFFREKLKDFKAVSVREVVHSSFLQNECGIENTCVVDPTFLLTGNDYAQLTSERSLRDHPFIFFLWYLHDDQMLAGVEFANMISRKYGLPIVHPFVERPPYLFAEDDGCMMYEGIENFLWYIRNAEVIVTNSYHTTLFSIYFRKPFYTFVAESMRSRFDTLCGQASIASRLVTRYIPADQITLDMDYDAIYSAMEPYRRESREFLNKALDVEGISQ